MGVGDAPMEQVGSPERDGPWSCVWLPDARRGAEADGKQVCDSLCCCCSLRWRDCGVRAKPKAESRRGTPSETEAGGAVAEARLSGKDSRGIEGAQ